MLPRKEGRCKVFILEGICTASENNPHEEDCDDDDDYRTITYEHLRLATAKLPSDACAGDVVVFKELAGYRNEGVAIFDGKAVQHLEDDSDIDDYGYVPKKFHVIENDVPIKYWSDAIDHNCIVWFDHNLVKDQLLRNLKCGTSPLGERAVYTEFNYNNKTYHVVWEDSDGTDEEHKRAFEYIRDAKSEIVFEYGGDNILTFNVYVPNDTSYDIFI